jgi:hypothetical protein
MASLLYGKFQLFHRNFSLMEKLQNETAMYTRLVYIDTVGHEMYMVDLWGEIKIHKSVRDAYI